MPPKADLFQAQLFLLNTGDRLAAALQARAAVPPPGSSAPMPFGAVVGLFASYARTGGVGRA